MTREEKLAGLAYRLDEIYKDSPSAAQPTVESSQPALYTPQAMKASQTVQQSAAVAAFDPKTADISALDAEIARVQKLVAEKTNQELIAVNMQGYSDNRSWEERYADEQNKDDSLERQLEQLKAQREMANRAQYEAAGEAALAKVSAEDINTLDMILAGPVEDTLVMQGDSDNRSWEERYAENEAYKEGLRQKLRQHGYDDSQIAKLLDYRQRQVNRQTYEAEIAKTKAYAENHEWGASLASIPQNLTGGLAALDFATQTLRKKMTGDDRPIDIYTGDYVGAGKAAAARETVSKDMSGFGAFVYNTVMSVADSAAAMAIGGGLSTLNTGISAAQAAGDAVAQATRKQFVSRTTSTLMGSTAATQAILDAKERGVSDVNALLTGVAAGVAEGFFEEYSVGRLLDAKVVRGTLLERTKQALKNMGVQALVEGSEEGATTIANAMADSIINGSLSDLETRIRRYVESGYSEADARKAVRGEWVRGLVMDVLGGMLSGGIMSAGRTVADIGGRSDGGIAPTSSDEALNGDAATTVTPQVENGAEGEISPHSDGSYTPTDPLAAIVAAAREGGVSAAQVRAVAKDPAALIRLGIDTNGKTASQIRAEVRAALDARAATHSVPTNETVLDAADGRVESDSGVVEQPAVVGATRNAADTPFDSASATQQPTSASTAQEAAQPEQPTGNTVGAAELGFASPFSQLEDQYDVLPSGEHPVRSDDVPRSTNGTDRVSQSVVTMKGAEAIPDSRIETIEQAVVNGKFSHIPIPNNVASRRARDSIRNKGFDRALQDFFVAVRSGKAGAVLTATGAHLLNNAANSNMSGEDFIELATACAQMLRNSSQGTQAWRILKQLTPEARLYQINREIARANDEIAEKASRSTLPTWLWMDRVGGELAQRMAAVAKGKSEGGVKSVTQTVLQDLYARALETSGIKRSAANNRRTNIEQLQDIFRNYENYSEAWNEAKETIRREFGDDPAVMEALESWMESALDVTDALSREITGREDIKLDKDLVERYLAAETEEQRDAVLDEMKRDVGRQMKASGMDKFTALRYTNMLGNFRTNVRNLGGNLGMRGLRVVHNAIATSLERLAGTERTRSLVVSKEYMDVGRNDFEVNKREAMGEDKYKPTNAAQGFMRDAREHMRVFTSRGLGTGLEAYRKGTQWLMNNKFFGDEAFARHAYARALAGYLKAQGITAEQFGSEEWKNEHTEAVDKARAFAVKEAQEATFRDNTALAEALVNLRVAGNGPMAKALNVMGDGLLPFRKTPANVLSRVMEYSPLGIGKTLLDAAMKGASNTALADREGALGDFARSGGDISGADIVNELAKCLTGTGLMVLGMLLRAGGYLRGKEDDEKRAALEELDGHQDYSLELPDGTSLTVDWFTPASMTLFMGAELMDIINEEGTAVKGVVDALMSVADPMIEMSMLQGIDDTLDNIRHTEGSSVLTIAATLALNYLFQATTNTLFGQLERTVTGESTMTYVDKESPISPWLQKEIGKASRKAPGDYNQIPYIDEWGQVEETGDVMTRAVNNLFNPGYVSRIENDAVNKELRRLYDKTGEGGVVPSRAEKSFTVGGEQRNLTAEEYVQYATTMGQTRYRYVQEAINSSYYKSLSDDAKASYIGDLYSYANYKAKREIEPKYDNTTYAKVAQAEAAGVSPLQYFKMKEAADADGNGSISQEEAKPYLDSQTELSNKQRDVLWSIINSSWKTNPYR